MTNDFYGVHWMLATPFREDETVDVPSILRLVDKAHDAGCRGVVALGVTGEVASLTDDERRLVAKSVIERADGLPVTLGTTSSSTQAAIVRSLEAESLGATAVMVAAPQMLRPNPDALFVHYQRIADAVDLPIVVQDYPQATGVRMSVPFISRLAEDVPGVRYLKLEDPPTSPKISALKDSVGNIIGIFGGLGGVFLLDELARGSIGAMTGFAYPELLVEVCKYMADGDRKKAEAVFYRHLPLILFEGQEGIGLSIRKEALHHRGLIASSKVRHPRGPVTLETLKELHRLIAGLGL